MDPARPRAATVWVFAALLVTGWMMAAAPASAYQQAPPRGGSSAERCDACGRVAQVGGADAEKGPWWLLYTHPSSHDRLLLGMWSYHLRDLSAGAAGNGLVGMVYDGWMAATFITTHGPRGYALGVERTWAAARRGPTEAMLGYRAGLLHGYDHRLFHLAELSPVIPFFQPVLLLRGGRLTLDATYTYVVFSFTAGFRF